MYPSNIDFGVPASPGEQLQMIAALFALPADTTDKAFEALTEALHTNHNRLTLEGRQIVARTLSRYLEGQATRRKENR